MSWIKGQLNKLFTRETYEEIEGYEEDYEVPIHDHRQRPVEQQKQEGNSVFRFPLITDDSIVPVQQMEKTTKHQRDENKVFELPKHLQPHGQSQVYDVEVSGIRELLERRQKGRGYSNVIRGNEVRERILRVNDEEKEILTKNPVREERQVDQEFTNPLANRKKFIPTNVPSPVYGFNKPTPIETLLNRHPEYVHNEPIDEEVSMPVVEEQVQLQSTQLLPSEETQHTPVLETVKASEIEEKVEIQPVKELKTLPKVEHVVSQLQLEDDETAIETPVNLAPIYYETKEKPPILAEEVMEEPLNDIQVKHVTIENSTIHIGQLNVEQMPQAEVAASVAENIQSPVGEESVEQPPIQEQSGSRLPFNVLMLKSDKQKLIARQLASQQFRTAIPKIEEKLTEEYDCKEEVSEANEVFEHPVDLSEPHVEAFESAIVINEPSIELEVLNEIVKVNIAPQPTEIVIEEKVESNELIETPELKEVIESILELGELEKEITEEPELITESIEPSTEPSESMEQQLELAPEKPTRMPYVKPPLEFLLPPEEKLEDREWMEEQGERLVEALSYFQVAAQIESIVQGPAVTQFEITVGQGTKVSKVRNLSDDIKLALAAKDIRINAPIPGKRSIGIEIPNRISRAVRLSEVTDSEAFQQSDSPLEAALGLDLTGKPMTIDLRKMPHGLIAGATGSGKSVCINSILVSLLYKANPTELKLMLIDPKMVELAPFNHIPHLVSPVITDVKAATVALKWAVEEMERRYQLFMHSGARHITGYNKLCEENKQYAQKLPYMLIVIDELADLMMMSPQDVEDAICRIAQKARACGIHLIVATQRPSVDVVTGTIKSNIPTRIAFAVSSQIDSRTIIDTAGADRLLGRGDMLYLGNGMSAPIRIQGTFVTDEEIEEVVEYVRGQGEPDYIFQQDELLKKAEAIEEQDELFEEVCRFVYEQGSASTSSLQRRYHIGYNRAARLIDMLESQGFVSEQKGSKPRDVFITETDLAIQFGG